MGAEREERGVEGGVGGRCGHRCVIIPGQVRQVHIQTEHTDTHTSVYPPTPSMYLLST